MPIESPLAIDLAPLRHTVEHVILKLIETTAIYAGAIGEEERPLAKRAWRSLESVFRTMRINQTGSPN